MLRESSGSYMPAELNPETEEILSSTNIEQIKNLTGRRLRRLFD